MKTTFALPVLTLAAIAGFFAFGPAPLAKAQQGKGNKGKGAPAQQIGTLKVQGNVYMIVAPGGNLAVQIGDWGVLVVDTPAEGASDAVIAEIRKLSSKPIRYLINTSVDHTAT